MVFKIWYSKYSYYILCMKKFHRINQVLKKQGLSCLGIIKYVKNLYIQVALRIHFRVGSIFNYMKSLLPKNRTLRHASLFVFVVAIITAAFVFAPYSESMAQAAIVQNGAVKFLTRINQILLILLAYLVYYVAVYPFSWFLVMLFNVLTAVASYNEFLSSAAVVKGWVVVRDIANMSIIVFLLIIAFSVMLRYEAYGNRKTLAKLLIMAVMINFSKTICGFFIDISQIVMLTFVNGFKFISGVSLVRSMQLDNMLTMATNTTDGQIPSLLKALAALVLTALFLFTITAVIIVIIMTLVWRIVNLWMLIILSPLAFLASAMPGGALGSMYSEWKKRFTNFLINGPILAFFLWLSLTIMNGLQQVNSSDPTVAAQSGVSNLTKEVGDTLGTELTKAFTGGNITLLLISIGLLVGSLVLSAQFGALGATAAYKKLKDNTKSTLKRGLKIAAKTNDLGIGAVSGLITGKPINVDWTAKQAKKQWGRAKDTGLGLFYKSGKAVAEGRNLWDITTNAIGSATGWKSNLGGRAQSKKITLKGRMDDMRQRADQSRQGKENAKEVATYTGAAERLRAMETYDYIKNSPDEDTQAEAKAILNALNMKPEQITKDSIEDQAQKVEKIRASMAAKKDKDGKNRFDMAELDNELNLDKDKDGKVIGASIAQEDRGAGWKESLSGGLNHQVASEFEKDEDAYEEEYQRLQDAAARKRSALGYSQALAGENAVHAAKMERIKEDYKNLDNPSEIASHIRAAGKNDARLGELLQQAVDEGMLKSVMKQLKRKGDFTGLRDLLGYKEDAKQVRPEHVQLFQAIDKAGVKGNDFGFAHGVSTDTATGITYFSDNIIEDNGKSQQFNAILDRIGRGKINRNELGAALFDEVEDGEYKLIEVGREAVKRFGSTFIDGIRRSAYGFAFEQSLIDQSDGMKSEIRDSIDKGHEGYDEGTLNSFERLITETKNKRGLGANVPTEAERDLRRRDEVIEKIEVIEKRKSEASPEFKLVLDAQFKQIEQQALNELRIMNKTLGLDANNKEKARKRKFEDRERSNRGAYTGP